MPRGERTDRPTSNASEKRKTPKEARGRPETSTKPVCNVCKTGGTDAAMGTFLGISRSRRFVDPFGFSGRIWFGNLYSAAVF